MPDDKKVDFENFIMNSDIRENLLNWYDIRPKSKILFIGNDIYKSCLKNENKVIMLTLDKLDAPTSEVTVYNETLLQFEKREEKVDYIIVINEMKNISKYVENDENTLNELIKISNRLLNEDGVLLVALNNKFSIRNFAGETKNGSNPFDVILGKEKDGSIYSKNELESIVKNSEFKYYKIYYPFPDYKLPSIIYSDDYLPNENDSKLNYLVYYNLDDKLVFSELEAVRELAKDKMLDYFSNSFFVEFTSKEENLSEVKFVSYNNFRKPENRLITKMYKNYVQKEPLSNESKSHIENIKNNIEILKNCNIDTSDEVKDFKLISKYQRLKTFSEYIGDLILDNKIDTAKELIKKWYEKLYTNFMCISCTNQEKNPDVFEKYGITVESDIKNKMHFIKDCLFDLIFENVFVEINDQKEFTKFIVYDQEWSEKNAPIEFILYRSIDLLFKNNSKLSKYLNKDDLFTEFGINEFVSYFFKLDSIIQENLLDKQVAKAYESTYSALTTIGGLSQEIKLEQEKFKRLKNDVERTNDEWQKRVESLEREIEDYKNMSIVKKLFKK